MTGEANTQPPTLSNAGAGPDQGVGGLTPALVRTVAEKVYALLLADLQIERERLRLVRRDQRIERGWR